MDNIGELGSIGVDGQEEAIATDGSASSRDTSALELVVVVLLPYLGHASLGLNSALGLDGLDSLELALGAPIPGLPLLASTSIPLSYCRDIEENYEAKAKHY